MWFPELEPGKQTAEKAKRICKRCPVKDPCLETALRNGEQHGIWGGLSPAERHRLKQSMAS